MEARYEGSTVCSAAEKSLYNPVYDEMLERRSSGSAGSRVRRNSEIRKAEKSVRKAGLTRTAKVYYKRKLLILLASAVVLTLVFGAIGVHAVQKGVACSEDELAYKMITVERGDTLWDIAQTCYRTTDDDIRTYIDNVRKMNHIHGDNLQEGQFLLIYYGAPENGSSLEVAEK